MRCKYSKNMNTPHVVFFSIFAGLFHHYRTNCIVEMKKTNFHFLSIIFILFFSLVLIGTSCHKKNAATEEISVMHTFPNTNWTYDEQVLDMPFTITDTTKDYSIEFVLNYDSTTNVLEELPVTITLIYPDGQETYVTSIFDFNKETNKNIMPSGNGNSFNINLVAFPRKTLNQSGEYKISFYRKAEKFDNYGFNSLTMKVLPLKREKR